MTIAVMGFCSMAAGSNEVAAQGTPFTLMTEDGAVEWPLAVMYPDSLRPEWHTALIEGLQHNGYFHAQLDSINWPERMVFVELGSVATLLGVRLKDDAGEVLLIDTLNVVFSAEFLDDHIAQHLGERQSGGYLGARIRIEQMHALGSGIWVDLVLERGPKVVIDQLYLVGDSRTSAELGHLLSGVSPGMPGGEVNLEKIQSEIQSRGLHSFVGTPSMVLIDDSTARIQVPVTPVSPGSFDLSAGLLPADGTGASRFVGSGFLLLKNAFGHGRTMNVAVDRLPNEASAGKLLFHDPYVRNLPVAARMSWIGLQQDSTYRDSRVEVGVGFTIRPGTELILTYSREQTTPLQAGRLYPEPSLSVDDDPTGSGGVEVGRAQHIAKSNGNYWGVEFAVQKVDNVLVPRQGVLLKALLESGSRQRTRSVISNADTTAFRTSVRQDRLVMEFSGYLKVHRAWSLVSQVSATISGASEGDISEWAWLGGTRSLRGYDERQFRAPNVGRASLEARGFVDESTYGFMFMDVGLINGGPVEQQYLAGYGIGMTLDTRAGPVNVSYAFNTKEGLTQGRIHLGISFGL